MATIVRPDTGAVPRLAVGDQCDFTCRDIVTEILIPFAAADILAEDEIFSTDRLIRRAEDALRKKCHLHPRAAGHFYEMNLGNIAEAGTDKHVVICRMPAQDRRGAKFGISSNPIGDCRWNRGDAVNDEIIICRNRLRLAETCADEEN